MLGLVLSFGPFIVKTEKSEHWLSLSDSFDKSITTKDYCWNSYKLFGGD